MNKSAAGLACLFVITGTAHFLWSRPLQRIVPPEIGHSTSLVMLSGVAELTIAAALTHPATRRRGAFAAVILLALVYPANIYMAIQPNASNLRGWLSWARLPLQAPLIWWAWRIFRTTRSAGA